MNKKTRKALAISPEKERQPGVLLALKSLSQTETERKRHTSTDVFQDRRI